MFEFGRHNVNGVHFEGLPADNFERVLPPSGWRIDYVGTTTYQANFSPETFANMSRVSGIHGIADRLGPLQDQLRVIAPLLENHRVHMPFWAVAATRLD